MKRMIMLWLWLCTLHIASAQVITILDDESGDPLELVVLASSSNANILLTNADGQADITPFINADIIEFRLLGYKVIRMSYDEVSMQDFIVKLTKEGISLDQVVVSASKWSQGSREVPAKVTMISPREIALQNPQTAADMLGASGEVFIQKSQQGGGSPMIRGFSTNRLLYVIDGVRMNTAIFRSGNLQNVISLDPFATESAEILFGPGSVIYGSDAIGGVMSFTTLTPQRSFSDNPLITGKSLLRYSTANKEITGHFDINVGWKKWALVSSISSNDFGDLRMGSHGPEEYLRPLYVQRQNQMDVIVANDDPQVQVPTGYSQINLMQKVLYAPNDKWDFQYGFHYSTTSSYSRYDRHIRYRDGLPRYGEWNYGPQIWMMNNLKLHHHGKTNIYDQSILNIAYQKFEESRIDRDIHDDLRHIRTEEVDAISANLDFIKSIGNKDKLFYGIEGVWDDVSSVGEDENILTGVAVKGPSRYPQATWSSYALYGNYLFHLNDQMTLQAGARFNYFFLDAVFDTTFYPFPYTTARIRNGALTGSLGFVMRPSDKLTWSANVSTGFRAPNVDDSGKVFDSEPGAVIVPNPDLKAEYAYNAEAGLAKVFGKNVRFDLTAYYTVLDNALVRRDFTLNGQDSIFYNGELSHVQAIRNAAVANVCGLQSGIEVKLPGGFGAAADLNYQVGEEELDDGSTSPSRHAAPFFGSAHVSYTDSRLRILLYTQFSGGKEFEDLPQEEKGKTEIYAIDENGDPYSPAWMTLNFKAAVHFEKNFTITAGLENITDLRYRTYSSGIVAPGRNFILSARFGF
jgi:hemoglobin/transferrin/lactoferrin receptor protein